MMKANEFQGKLANRNLRRKGIVTLGCGFSHEERAQHIALIRFANTRSGTASIGD